MERLFSLTRALVARKRKIFALFFALAASIGLSWAETTIVTWNNDDLNGEWGTIFSKDGVTLNVGAFIDFENKNFMGDGTFTTTLGNFTKIEVNAEYNDISGEGWSGDYEHMTWTGNASSVSFNGDITDHGSGNTQFVFTIGDPLPTYTVALEDGTVNADKVTLSKTSAVEGATVTVTPDDEYEITAFSAYYVVVNGQVGSINTIDATLDPATGAYSFTMPAYDVTIEATIAAKPVPEGDIFAGFTATAGSGGFNNEGHANLVDGKFTSGNVQTDWTKWCADNSYKSVPTGESGDACWWIDFEASAALDLTGYILTTGNDNGNEHGRNPRNWVLKAKLNADDAWTTIATVTNDVTMKNKSFKDYKFFVDQSGTYQYFRFEVLAEQGAGVMQLCELRLIGAEPVVVTTHTLQLVADPIKGSVAVTNLLGSGIVDNGDGTYDVPEGAEVTLLATPNEGYQFTGWKAGSVGCDFTDCGNALSTVDNPLTFDMYNGAAFMAEFAAVAPQPAEDVNITPNVDPDHAGVYYSTFFDSSVKYELPENVEAYIVTTVSGDAMQLQKVANAGQTIPAGAGVILKSRVNGFTLAPSDADAVSVEGNRLEGSDVSIATPTNCYVLSCKNDLVGFYHYNGANLNPHKAYIIYAPNSGNQAPQRLRFVFDQATGVENVQNSDIRSQKVVENGQLIIIRNGVRYNAAGQNVK